MKIWDRIGVLRTIFFDPDAAEAVGRRWTLANDHAEGELAADVIRLGGVLRLLPARFDGGIDQRDPIDPTRLAYEQGQRDMALRLLALMGVTPNTLASTIGDE